MGRKSKKELKRIELNVAQDKAEEILSVSSDPDEWESLSPEELHLLFRYFFVCQAKVRHIMVRKQKSEGSASYPERIPTHEEISTGSLLLTEKFGHGEAIAAAISICDKGWYVWQRDKKHPEGCKTLMQFAYIKQHLANENHVMVQMSAKGTAKIATQADRDRMERLRKKYGLPIL